MAQPTGKFFGSLKLAELGQAVKEGSKVTEHEKYGKQLKITAAQWEDGGITINIYNSDTKENLVIGNLRVSQFTDEAPKQAPKEVEEDLPF